MTTLLLSKENLETPFHLQQWAFTILWQGINQSNFYSALSPTKPGSVEQKLYKPLVHDIKPGN